MTVILPPITQGAIDTSYLRNLVGEAARVIIEIGANNGLSTLSFLEMFPNAKIYAFEPDPRAIEKFKMNVTDPKASLFEMAIGAKDGEAQFNVSSGLPENMPPEERAKYPLGWDLSGSLRPPKTHKSFWPWVKFEKKIIVQVKQLDSWVRENGVYPIDLIWADTQGAEGDLIAGGAVALATTRYFYTEYSNEECYEGQVNLEEIMDMLPHFRIVLRFKEDVLFENMAMDLNRP
jgi:FkbM family methyltransferase